MNAAPADAQMIAMAKSSYPGMFETAVPSFAPRYNGGSNGKWYGYFKYPMGAHSHTENVTPLKLRDMARFAVAQDLWHRNVDLNTKVIHVKWESQTTNVISLVREYCKGYPTEIIDAIIDCVKIIGEEMSRLVDYFKLNHLFGCAVKNMRACDMHWTSSFTIDRCKTAIMFPLHARKGSDRYPESVLWLINVLCSIIGFTFEPTSNCPRMTKYFEEHTCLVYQIWVCYMETTSVSTMRNGILDLVNPRGSFWRYLFEHLRDFRTYYEENTAAENIFRFVVVTGQVEFLPYYLAKIDAEKRNQNLFVMVKLVITEYNRIFFRSHGCTVVNAVIFLWSKMDESDKLRFLQENLKPFGKFVMSVRGTEPLVSFMKLYNASEQNFKDVRRLLKEVAAEIQPTHKKSDKYWQLFYILYQKVAPWLEVMDVIDLLENILRVADIKTAVRIFKYSKNKNILLAEIHDIWNDFWKDTVKKDVFLMFFFEVQSDVFKNDSSSE